MRRWIASLAVAAMLAAAVPVQASPGALLTDISGHWARTYVESGVAAGYVAGYPDGTYRPDATITRAEFIKLLGAAMRLGPTQDRTGFAEEGSPAPHWAFTQGHIQAAVGAGLLVPSDYNNHFGPDTVIKRREIVLAAVRALGKEALALGGQRPLRAPDAAAYADWLKNYASVALESGIITGYEDGSLRLERTATRAEALVMVQRILKKVTMDLSPEMGPGAGSVRHPGEGEPYWRATGDGRPTITNGTAEQDYTFADDVTDVALLPAPGKAAWVRYKAGTAGVLGRLAQGKLAEAGRYEGQLPELLAVGDDGRLFFSTGETGLLVATPEGQAEPVAEVADRVTFGAVDFAGIFWGVGGNRIFRVAVDGTVMPYEAEASLEGARQMAMADDGALWLFEPGGSEAKVEAVRLEYGKVTRRVTLLNAYAGGLGTEARVEPVGRTGPFLWLNAFVRDGGYERTEGLYRFNLDSGEFVRQVAPQAMSAGFSAVAAPDGGPLLKDVNGNYWRILP